MLHLFHPALVHFAVAFLVFGGLCEAAGIIIDRDGPRRFGGLLVILGTAFVLPTIASGYLAANSLALAGEAREAVETHELAGWILGGWFLGCLFWKAWTRGALPGRQRYVYAAALLVGVALTVYGALLGGGLVYEHGAGVAVPI